MYPKTFLLYSVIVILSEFRWAPSRMSFQGILLLFIRRRLQPPIMLLYLVLVLNKKLDFIIRSVLTVSRRLPMVLCSVGWDCPVECSTYCKKGNIFCFCGYRRSRTHFCQPLGCIACRLVLGQSCCNCLCRGSLLSWKWGIGMGCDRISATGYSFSAWV